MKTNYQLVKQRKASWTQKKNCTPEREGRKRSRKGREGKRNLLHDGTMVER